MRNGIYVVDRIEEGIAVLVPDEGGDAVNLPTDILPGIAEGTAVAIGEDGKSLRILTGAERPPEREQNRARLHTLFGRKNK